MKRFFKIFGRVLLALLLLLILLWVFVQTDWGQNWLAGQVTSKLSKDLQTKISIKHVSIGLFNRLDLEGVYIEDQKKDTLLYAGLVKVRITDWFFFKDKADLKYIGLEDAVVNFNRTDSVWNYAFLGNYFASNDTATVKKKAGIEFNLKKVELKNVAFAKKDAWAGNDLIVKVGGLNLDAEDISIGRKNVIISNAEITNPYFSSLNYKAKKIDSSSSGPQEWTVQFNRIKINNGRFRLDVNDYTPTVTYFDSKHIDFSRINATLDHFKMQGDTLTGNADLTTAERSGVVVKSLKTNLTIKPGAFVFDDLLLQTNRSTITDYFSMQFANTKSFNDFEHAVDMKANFKQAIISSDDLAFFIPDAKTWKKNIRINGHVDGAVDRLSADNLELWLGNNTYVNGNVSVIGLPDINKTLLNIEAKDLRTTYGDAASFFPALRRVSNPNVRALNYLRFKGTFTGFVNDFVSYGTIQTALGTLVTDVNMKLPKNGEPVYSGSISTEGFQLGTFINNKDLGVVDFHGDVKGRSFDWNKISLAIDGTIHRIKYRNYTYQNIKGKGTVKAKQLNGDFAINDPNADLDLHGLIDFSKKVPVFDATAQIRKANLKALQLTDNDMRLKGDFNLNIQGNNFSNLIGTARINNAELLANDQKLSFDFLNVASYYINNERNLSISSNEFDGKLTGNFDITTLPSAFKLFLSRYYPSYIPKPKFFTPQNFSFEITTGIVEDYLRLLDSSLTGFNNSHITGSLNTTANSMTIDADVPSFAYQQYAFSDVKLAGKGDLDSLVITGSAADTKIGKSIALPQTTFSIRASNDVSNISINTTSNQVVNKASLAAQVRTFSDGIALHFFPSSFILNGKTWTIEQGGELNLRKSAVANGQVIFREGPQLIKIETVASGDFGSANDIHVTLENLNLSDLSPLIMKDNRLEGTLSGKLEAINPTEKLFITADLKASQIKLDADSLGDVMIKGNYNNVDGMLTVRGNNADPDHKIDFDVAMDLKDSANKFQDRISLRPTNFQLKYLERFIGEMFTDIQGTMTGTVDIVGEGTDRDFLAKVRVKDAALKVVFTQVSYKLEDTDIELKKDYIDLNNIRLRDRKGNLGAITGGIKHHGFKDMYFDLSVETVSSQMELLNTTYKDNQQFYGRAWGSGAFTLVGPQYDMYMDIVAKASSTDSSFITLPPAQTKETGQASFLVEKKYGREMTDVEKRGGESNITYGVTVTATPMVNMEVVLDELTGDIIRGRGNGTLKISSGTNAPLRLSGRYNIEEGSYVYSFQSLFKRPFIVNPKANNYIEWNGDPYDANIHLDADYTAINVSFAPLVSLFGTDAEASSLARMRDNVTVSATLTGNLFTPKIDFRLGFPSSIYTKPSLAFAIQQLERNTNELTKQVTFLVVTNSFAPYESTQSLQRPFEELAYNTISGVFYNFINRYLNQMFSRILGDKFTLNLTGSLYNRNLLDPNAKGIRLFNQATSTVSVGTSILNGRVIFSVGGSFDVPLETTIQQSFQILPDVTVEVLLNKTGSLRATIFYRQNIDFLYGVTTGGNPQTRRYGTSLSFNKEFDSFREFLFGRKKKKDQKQVTDSTTQPQTSTQLINQ